MSATTPPPPDTPSPHVLLLVYIILGSILSFTLGHEPGSLPDNILAELCPCIVVICGFLCSYSVYDVMACGVTKVKHGVVGSANAIKDRDKYPEEVFLAERAQMNQVEQLPCFLMGTIFFSVLVNGKVGGVLSLFWAVLRRLYASRYRKSVGIPIYKKGLSVYTIPCYFIVNVMLAGSAVQAVRWMIAA